MLVALSFVTGWAIIVCLLVRLLWADRHDPNLDAKALQEKIRRLERDCAEDCIVDSEGHGIYYRPELAIVLASPSRPHGTSASWANGCRCDYCAQWAKATGADRRWQQPVAGVDLEAWRILREAEMRKYLPHPHNWEDVYMFGKLDPVERICKTCGEHEKPLVPPT